MNGLKGLMDFLGDCLWVVKVGEGVELHRADDPPGAGQVLDQLSSYLTDAELEWRRPPEPLMDELFGEKGWVDKRDPTQEARRGEDPSEE